MSNEIDKSQVHNVDGFDTYEDEEEHASQQGSYIKFTNTGHRLISRDGTELSPDLELIVVNVSRELIKWGDNEVLERKVLGPGEKFPDIEKLNEDTPQSEWRNGPGGWQGPWQAQHVVRLLDPETMDRFIYATSTIGGHIAVRELVDRTKWMRAFRGENVVPVVKLSDTFMKTRQAGKNGGRQRPHFARQRWITFGRGGLPQAEGSAAKTVEPTLAEEMDDKIQY